MVALAVHLHWSRKELMTLGRKQRSRYLKQLASFKLIKYEEEADA